MDRIYDVKDLVNVAKRENNTKRKYLFVNPLQGKHVPAKPKETMDLFSKMASLLVEKYKYEKLLVIGFAETATAIGAFVSILANNVSYYMNTTRENVVGAEYLYFSESHSHATEQRLVYNGLKDVISSVDRIVFVEDEVTTGNTILKLINQINNIFFDMPLRYGIMSILNSMSEERLHELEKKGIVCNYILQIPFEYNKELIDTYQYSTKDFYNSRKEYELIAENDINEIQITGIWNSRIINNTMLIKQKLESLAYSFFEKEELVDEKMDVLIVGTEEFMTPGMYLGSIIEKKYPKIDVYFHATTRSPIEVSNDKNYPLYNRSILDSVYEKGRNTFIYNLRKYDKVFVLTEAMATNYSGLISLLEALKFYGNDQIEVIYWR